MQTFHGPVGQVAAGDIINIPADHICGLSTDDLEAHLDRAIAERTHVQREGWSLQRFAVLAGALATLAAMALLIAKGSLALYFLAVLPTFIGMQITSRHGTSNGAALTSIDRRIRAMQMELDMRVTR